MLSRASAVQSVIDTGFRNERKKEHVSEEEVNYVSETGVEWRGVLAPKVAHPQKTCFFDPHIEDFLENLCRTG